MSSTKRQRLDVLFALKAIALSDELTGTEKRVAAAIVDSFNHKTAQCDPSLNRIAHLLGASRRTVIRAVIRLEQRRFVLKRRHGGYSHRNSYEPNWIRYREIEVAWAAHKRTKHWKSTSTEMSHCQSQIGHPSGAADGTQTSLTTLSSKPSDRVSSFEAATTSRKGSGGRSRENSSGVSKSPQTCQAARVAAERRWYSQLHQRFSSDPSAYAVLIGAIDTEMQRAATEAELRRHGAGLELILRELSGELKGKTAGDRPLGHAFAGDNHDRD